ncbi:L-lactate permease [Hansschlegelia plantiphila]|uniref:L-lactate permease n=1 Tax=Hansschlegelia plantiphila TaxID=374655 RepID=A0A9W6IZS7_9HYPH|nr:L-lactate permease [Hansschlegelia plantiphila]GLK66650.1 L-lactate permease [Hansschlegelia plantiphila]
MVWQQVYDPFGNAVISTLVAAIPIIVLLAGIGVFGMKAHMAALAGLAAALLIAVFGQGMPVDKAGMTALFGAAYGLLPIGWIIINIIFLYQLTSEKGYFKILQDSIAGITDDRRLQLLLIAFSFGAFFEGAGGFGTPVAVTGAILIGLGFSPLAASGLSLIANTAPVAFGALGTPVIALAGVTGLPLTDLSAMIGRQLPFFSVLVPFWLIVAFAGFRGMFQIWPAILIAGVAFAVPQFLVSNYHGPWLVDVVAAIASIGCLTLFLRKWSPREIWTSADGSAPTLAGGSGSVHVGGNHERSEVLKAWIPWLILSVVVFCWGIPQVKAFLDGVSILKFPVAHLDQLVQRVPPVVTAPKAEAAVYSLNWLSATGSGILLSAIIAGFVMGFSPWQMVKTYGRTLHIMRFSILTISAMMALGFVTRYSGVDATLGLAFAQTGWLYPFFGTLLGWLGVALTGSDTSSNVLFGSLQKISAEQLGLSPTLMAAANSSGGVMGKMIDAQSIVVASTATRWYGHEKEILRYVFLHSIALASLMGLLVMAQAYIAPFTHMVIGAP